MLETSALFFFVCPDDASLKESSRILVHMQKESTKFVLTLLAILVITSPPL